MEWDGIERARLGCVNAYGARAWTGIQRASDWHSARVYFTSASARHGACTCSYAHVACLKGVCAFVRARVSVRGCVCRVSLLDRARAANPNSVSTANLPPLSDDLAVRQLLGLTLADIRQVEREAA